MYDTDTAKLVAESWNGIPQNSFRYAVDCLYQKKTGEFFLYGYGYAASQYAVRCRDGTWGPGESICPLTADAAIAWAEKNLSADEYESIFGKVSEEGGSDKVIFTARVPKFVWASLKRKADAQGISVPSYIYTLLEESVDK